MMLFRLVLVLFGLLSSVVYAGNFELDFPGLSYHFVQISEPKLSPLRLDSGAIKVFNPGIGLGYDFRPLVISEGIYPLLKSGFFFDCGGYGFCYLLGQLRWKHQLLSNVYTDVSMGGGYLNRVGYDEQGLLARRSDFFPVGSVGIGTFLFDKYVQLNVTTYDPSALIFFYLTVSI